MDKGINLGTIIAVVLLIIATFVEVAIQTIWWESERISVFVRPFIWLAAGLIGCASGLYLSGFKKTPLAFSLDYFKRYNNALLILSVCLFSSVILGFKLSEIFSNYPPDATQSDIIPSIELYVRRLLSGEKVYAPMEFPGWTVNPTYFPLLWLPYVFSELLSIDYHWTAYLVFIIGIYLFNLREVRHQVPYAEIIIKALIPFLILLAFTSYRSMSLGLTVEMLPIGFYLILCATIFVRYRFLMAIGILLCLLSRYAFTFWLPVYFIVMWVELGFKEMFKIGLMVLAGVLLIYVFPFLWGDWEIFANGLAYYEKTAVGQWFPQSWQAAGDVPWHLNKGMGFAIYFYEFLDGDPLEKLAVCKKIHILACGIAALLILGGYFLWRNKGLNTRIYMITSLKFYLLIFYGFFQVPFAYLFMLPLFISIPIIYHIHFTNSFRLNKA